MNGIEDIYFNREFLKVYEEHEKGVLKRFDFKDDDGEMFMFFIQKPILEKGGEGFFDITTPYGYGGPVMKNYLSGREKSLSEKFFSAFESYCHAEKIISFFCRFHPIIENAAYCQSGFDEIKLTRKIVVTDLRKDLSEEITKRAWKDSRYASRNGVVFEENTADRYLTDFINMYYELMSNKQAGDFYFFSETYFDYLFKNFPENVKLVTTFCNDIPMNHNMIFIYGDVAYGHLMASNPESRKYRASDLADVGALEYAKKMGCSYYVLGGGFTSDPDDSLLKYKLKFSTSPLRDFFIGTKVYNKEIYDRICKPILEQNADALDSHFFPLYRNPDFIKN